MTANTRGKLWLPFERQLREQYPGSTVGDDLSLAIEQMDLYMTMLCGVRPGVTRSSVYRLLGWLASRGRIEQSGDVPHDVSTGSARDTD